MGRQGHRWADFTLRVLRTTARLAVTRGRADGPCWDCARRPSVLRIGESWLCEVCAGRVRRNHRAGVWFAYGLAIAGLVAAAMLLAWSGGVFTADLVLVIVTLLFGPTSAALWLRWMTKQQ